MPRLGCQPRIKDPFDGRASLQKTGDGWGAIVLRANTAMPILGHMTTTTGILTQDAH